MQIVENNFLQIGYLYCEYSRRKCLILTGSSCFCKHKVYLSHLTYLHKTVKYDSKKPGHIHNFHVHIHVLKDFKLNIIMSDIFRIY